MSFILDALKKSQNEHQRRIGPLLADVQINPRRNERPWWAAVVAGLLLANLGVLSLVLMRSGASSQAPQSTLEPQPSQVQAHPPSGVETPPAVQLRSQFQPQRETASPAVRSLADEAATFAPEEPNERAAPHLTAAAAVPEGPPIVRTVKRAEGAPGPARSAFEFRPDETDEVLPTQGELAAGGTALPELHLDIHVHSANPSERFVFVNMRKYVEGQTLSEGPVVERITAQGVILSQRGLRFLLPRQ
ncbi:MAG TPA: general secretion pathway protein GspB [Steroidobacter sp.]|jgi:general secretion pathway protein B|nr:general secretion pathway protein GspB [Steroidobacter sp.]